MFRAAATTLLLSTALVATAAKPKWHELSGAYTFESYVRDFDRGYASDAEHAQRKGLFAERLKVVLQHNAEPHHTWKRGINHLSDRTPAELKALHGLDKPLLHAQKATAQPYKLEFAGVANVSDLPDSVDWRTHTPPVLTGIKNQGSCGSCWSFASAETMESHWAIKTGELEELSEQFLLDCTKNPGQCGGTGGCAGGTAEVAYTTVMNAGGIPSEWTYPYISGTGTAGQCHGLDANGKLPPQVAHTGKVMAAANMTKFYTTKTNDYASMMTAVATKGPLAISVDAGAWHDYESGVFDGGNSTNPDLDHLVQLVGYGSLKPSGEDGYWIVRNSWTPLWGDNGFIFLARPPVSNAPACGVDVTPGDGNGCKNGPSTVKVCGQNGMLFDGVFPCVGDECTP